MKRIRVSSAEVRTAFEEWWPAHFGSLLEACRFLEQTTGVGADAWTRRLSDKTRHSVSRGVPTVSHGWWVDATLPEKRADQLLTAIGRPDIYRRLVEEATQDD